MHEGTGFPVPCRNGPSIPRCKVMKRLSAIRSNQTLIQGQQLGSNYFGSAGGWQALVGRLKDSPHWNEDPVTVQESMRDEWH